MEGRVIQLSFSAVFDRVGHRSPLHELRSIGVGEQFLSILSEFLSDRRQHIRLDGKVSASVDAFLRVPQSSVFGPVFILYTSKLFHIAT